MELIEKQRRVAVLKKIDAWNKVRCTKCHEEAEGNHHTAIKCTCKAAVAVRKLGVEYELGGKLKRERRIKELLSSFTDLPLSVDTYDMLKEMGVEEKFLMRHVNITNAQFNEWKYNVGRSKNPPRVNEEERRLRDEYTKWREIAEGNGIKKSTFQARIRQYGLTYEEAVKPEMRKSTGRTGSAWLETAKANNINVKTFNTRKRQGWTEEAAATIPVRKKEMAK